MKRRPTLAVLMLLGILAPMAAQAAVNPVLTDTHTLNVGVYDQSSDITVSSTRDGDQKQDIDLERLGLDDEYLAFTASYRWRINDRWSVELAWFTFESDSSSVIEDTFTFDGQEFRVGANLDLTFSVDSFLLDAFYSVYKSDNAELRLGAGLHSFDFDLEFKASAGVDDVGVSGSFADEDLLAPLPNLRIDGLYAFSDRWSIYAGAGWLSANYGDYEGRYLFTNVKVAYRIIDGLSLALGYQIVDTDVTYSGSRREIDVETDYHGPTAYLSYSF